MAASFPGLNSKRASAPTVTMFISFFSWQFTARFCSALIGD
jgi:hypothetical protein